MGRPDPWGPAGTELDDVRDPIDRPEGAAPPPRPEPARPVSLHAARAAGAPAAYAGAFCGTIPGRAGERP